MSVESVRCRKLAAGSLHQARTMTDLRLRKICLLIAAAYKRRALDEELRREELPRSKQRGTHHAVYRAN
jgi:hypothetical protein